MKHQKATSKKKDEIIERNKQKRRAFKKRIEVARKGNQTEGKPQANSTEITSKGRLQLAKKIYKLGVAVTNREDVALKRITRSLKNDRKTLSQAKKN